jgi:arsenite methyltransferase
VLVDIVIVDSGADLNVYTTAAAADAANTGTDAPRAVGCGESAVGCGSAPSCCQPSSGQQDSATIERDLEGIDLNEWAGSFKIFAVKA